MSCSPGDHLRSPRGGKAAHEKESGWRGGARREVAVPSRVRPPCKALLDISDDVVENVFVLLLPFPREVVTLIALERRVQTHLLIGLNVLSPNKRNRKQMYLWIVQRLKPKVRCTKTTPGTAQLYHCSQVQVLRPPPPWLISSF